MLNKRREINKYKSGFTLLEMIVSLGIFTVVAVIAVGSLVRITSLNRQAQSLQLAMNNVNYILESISREMRFGSAYHCLSASTYNGNLLSAQECNNGLGNSQKAILFNSSTPVYDSNGNFQCYLINAYWFNRGAVFWDIKKSKQTACDQSMSESSASSLVDTTNVKITEADFTITSGVLGYSFATIRLAGYSGTKENEKSHFDIRTGVAQRISDI